MGKTPEPVLIVGAGPTGMTAAMELARFGVSVRLIEKTRETATTSRAVGVQARTLELFEQRGMVDEMLRLGNKSVAGSIYDGGKRVFRLEYDQIDSRYPYLLFISQAETERILREQLARDGVTIERGVEMVALAQTDSHEKHGGVTVTLRRADGSLEAFEASYLISAEGAHSTVRTTLGLRFEGKSLAQDYALGDFHVDGDLPATDFHIFSSGHGFMGLFPMGNGRFRMIASNPLSKPEQGDRARAGGVAEDVRRALAHPGQAPRSHLEQLVPHQQPHGGPAAARSRFFSAATRRISTARRAARA